MVQILPRPQSKAEMFAQLISGGLSGAARGGEMIQGAMRDKKERETLAGRFGDTFKNIYSPDVRKQLLGSELEKESLANRAAQEQELGLPDYETIKGQFGEKFANLYKAASVGGKTELLKTGLESLLRGDNIQDILGETEAPTVAEIPRPEITEEEPEFAISPKSTLPDYTKRPKGYTPKEWRDELKTWRKDNTEVFEKNKDRLKSLATDILGTKSLQKLNKSGKLPSGFSKFIINPKTGAPYTLAQLGEIQNPEAEEWVKEVTRFGNRAKDAFGSRVTNFDLSQYMKQFPSLLNSEEGRRRILRMMEINYELDNLYEKAVQKIYDEKGLGGIPPEEVDRVARGRVTKKAEKLRDEYLKIDEENFHRTESSGGKRSLEEIFG